MPDRWVIVGCSAIKGDQPALAVDLYRSAYFKCATRWARSVVADDRLLILSAKYGLVLGTDTIAPYRAVFPGNRPRTPGARVRFAGLEPAISDRTLGLQLAGRGISGVTIVLAPASYGTRLRAASHDTVIPWNPFLAVLERDGKGHQLGWQAHEMIHSLGRMP